MDKRIGDYLSYLESVRGLSDRTLRVYGDDLERYETFLDGADIDAADAHDIRSFAGTLVMEGKASVERQSRPFDPQRLLPLQDALRWPYHRSRTRS